MGKHYALDGIIAIALGIIGVATVSVLVSRRANTSAVIQSAASGFGNLLAVAQSPVTGASARVNLSYPGGMGLYGDGSFSPYLGG